MSIHGITEEMVKDKPFFKDIAKEVHDFIGDADLAGYNSNRFDVPMLMEELDRAGHQLDMTTRRTIDVMRIFTKDRKSTRLNSSHVSLSYAVICLNKQQYHIDPV